MSQFLSQVKLEWFPQTPGGIRVDSYDLKA